jgi:hypothetical protein
MEMDLLFQKSDLIPVIIQDADTLQVLMLGYTNREALELSMDTGTAWFWSRSRRKLWNKGESSGIFCISEKFSQTAIPTLCSTCALPTPHLPHRGGQLLFQSCYGGTDMNDTLKALYDVIEDRKTNRREDSYTCYLFQEGRTKS